MKIASVSSMLLALILAAGCSEPAVPPVGHTPTESSGASIDSLVKRYLDFRWKYNPQGADDDGLYAYSDQLAPSTADDFLAQAQFLRTFLQELESLPVQNLNLDERVDLQLMISQCRVSLREIETSKDWQRDPSRYNPFRSIHFVVSKAYAPVPERAVHLISRLRQVPDLLKAGRENLQNPPRPFTTIAVRSCRNALPFFQENVTEFAGQAGGYGEEILQANREALTSLESYCEFLENDLLPRSNGDVAIGKQAYDFYLREFHMLDEDSDSLLLKGKAYFEETEKLLEEIAARIDPNSTWQQITEKLRSRHPSREGLRDAYCEVIQRAKSHVIAKNLVTIPAGEQVLCIDTPPSERAFSPFGTFQSPAPFSTDKTGYLILHPIEAGLPQAQEERLLRAHDYTWIQVIAPHESYPGHHLQALKAQENPRTLRKVYSSPLFSEGWGLYTEELMYETGFFDPPDETRLTQLRTRLWRSARIILDIQLHTGQITPEQARDFLVRKVLFDPDASAGEVNIYLLQPTYVISYMVGFKEIMRLREDYRRQKGESAGLLEFHDRLLTEGSLPFRLMRRLVLEQ